MSASELAIPPDMTEPSMGYLIEYLEHHGYVERVSDPSDGRAHLARLTSRGWEMSQTGRQIVRHHPPLRPRPYDPTQAIKDFPHQRQIGSDKRPFVITYITGIWFSVHPPV